MNVAEYFNSRSRSYDAFLDAPVISRARQEECRMLSRLVLENFSHHENVLEIGCGTGHYTFMLSNVCKQVTAIDLSEGMLKVLNEKIRMSRTRNVEIIHDNFTQMNSKKFGNVFCASVVGYANEPENFIKKIYAQCNNKLIITAPNCTFLGKLWQNYFRMWGIKYNTFSKNKFRKMLCSAGFRNVRIFEAGKSSFFPGHMLIALAGKDDVEQKEVG